MVAVFHRDYPNASLPSLLHGQFGSFVTGELTNTRIGVNHRIRRSFPFDGKFGFDIDPALLHLPDIVGKGNYTMGRNLAHVTLNDDLRL